MIRYRSLLLFEEGRAFTAAANAGARAAIITASAFDAAGRAGDLAATKHRISLSAVERVHSDALAHQSGLEALLAARRGALDPGDFRRGFRRRITALLALPAPVLRLRLCLAGFRCRRLLLRREQVAASKEAYSKILESTFTDFRDRAAALRPAPAKASFQGEI